MRSKLIYGPATLLMALLLTSCGGKTEEEKEAEEAKTSVSGAMKSLQDVAIAVENEQKDGKVATVDFRTLKALLPADADGLPRKEASGEKTGAMGFTVSTAEAKYASADGEERIEITIVDAGGTGALMGLAAWSMVEVDKETETGYEKTTTLDGNKAYEEYNTARKTGEVAVIVAKRFVVTAEGSGVSMEKIKATLKDVDLGKLAELK